MKKVVVLLLVVFSIVACGGSKKQEKTNVSLEETLEQIKELKEEALIDDNEMEEIMSAYKEKEGARNAKLKRIDSLTFIFTKEIKADLPKLQRKNRK